MGSHPRGDQPPAGLELAVGQPVEGGDQRVIEKLGEAKADDAVEWLGRVGVGRKGVATDKFDTHPEAPAGSGELAHQFRVEVHPDQSNLLLRAIIGQPGRHLEELARQPARNGEHVDWVSSLDDQPLNFAARIEIARSKGASRLEVEKERVEQVADEELTGRPVAVNVVREIVAAGIFNRLSAERSGESEVVHGQEMELAFSNQPPRNRRGASRPVVEGAHRDSAFGHCAGSGPQVRRPAAVSRSRPNATQNDCAGAPLASLIRNALVKKSSWRLIEARAMSCPSSELTNSRFNSFSCCISLAPRLDGRKKASVAARKPPPIPSPRKDSASIPSIAEASSSTALAAPRTTSSAM